MTATLGHRRAATHRAGFTIIELAVVIVLISLLTGVAVMKLRGPYQKAQFVAAVQRIEQLDQLVRSRARQHRQAGAINIDLKRGKLLGFDDAHAKKPLSQVSLGTTGRIDRIIMGGRTTRSGVAKIHVGPHGQTPSYALRLKGSNDEQTWLLFASRTGQMIELESDREVGKLLLPKTTTGPDVN